MGQSVSSDFNVTPNHSFHHKIFDGHPLVLLSAPGEVLIMLISFKLIYTQSSLIRAPWDTKAPVTQIFP